MNNSEQGREERLVYITSGTQFFVWDRDENDTGYFFHKTIGIMKGLLLVALLKKVFEFNKQVKDHEQKAIQNELLRRLDKFQKVG